MHIGEYIDESGFESARHPPFLLALCATPHHLLSFSVSSSDLVSSSFSRDNFIYSVAQDVTVSSLPPLVGSF